MDMINRRLELYCTIIHLIFHIINVKALRALKCLSYVVMKCHIGFVTTYRWDETKYGLLLSLIEFDICLLLKDRLHDFSLGSYFLLLYGRCIGGQFFGRCPNSYFEMYPSRYTILHFHWRKYNTINGPYILYLSESIFEFTLISFHKWWILQHKMLNNLRK